MLVAAGQNGEVDGGEGDRAGDGQLVALPFCYVQHQQQQVKIEKLIYFRISCLEVQVRAVGPPCTLCGEDTSCLVLSGGIFRFVSLV